MRPSRRAFCLGSLSLFVFNRALAVPSGVGVADAYPIPTNPAEPLPTLDQLYAGYGSHMGVGDPRPEEREIALQILNAAPSRANPIAVAEFFRRIGEPDSTPNNTWIPYVHEWPARYNPVIVKFFEATDRRPIGDCTAWCSAFVNWCIMRGREGREDTSSLLPRTASAASQSFKNWGTETETPKRGDIALFVRKDDETRGHVAFFDCQNETTVTVIGGNQGSFDHPGDSDISTCPATDKSTGGKVSRVRFLKNGRILKLRSFRTDPSLHDLPSLATKVATDQCD